MLPVICNTGWSSLAFVDEQQTNQHALVIFAVHLRSGSSITNGDSLIHSSDTERLRVRFNAASKHQARTFTTQITVELLIQYWRLCATSDCYTVQRTNHVFLTGTSRSKNILQDAHLSRDLWKTFDIYHFKQYSFNQEIRRSREENVLFYATFSQLSSIQTDPFEKRPHWPSHVIL